jgi:hypothetical protein
VEDSHWKNVGVTAHQRLFQQKNVTLPALKAVGKCERDKGRGKTASERYGNKGEHERRIF